MGTGPGISDADDRWWVWVSLQTRRRWARAMMLAAAAIGIGVLGVAGFWAMR